MVKCSRMFAGYRFLLAGLVLLIFAVANGKAIGRLKKGQYRQIVILGLTQTTLQYVFFYIGLAYTTGVKGSIMNATGTFFSVILAHYIYKNDRLSFNKIIGCSPQSYRLKHQNQMPLLQDDHT